MPIQRNRQVQFYKYARLTVIKQLLFGLSSLFTKTKMTNLTCSISLRCALGGRFLYPRSICTKALARSATSSQRSRQGSREGENNGC